MNTKAIFSSARHNWKTPGRVYADLDAEFHFDFDPCPQDPEVNGLECDWGSVNFVNPPYREIKLWLQKAVAEHRKGNTVVALLPSRTGTDWFHNCVLPYATEIRFLRGRLQFDNCGMNAPFDSMIIILKQQLKENKRHDKTIARPA